MIFTYISSFIFLSFNSLEKLTQEQPNRSPNGSDSLKCKVFNVFLGSLSTI